MGSRSNSTACTDTSARTYTDHLSSQGSSTMAAPYDDESLASTAGSPPSLPTSSSVPAAGPPGSQPLGAGGVALEDNRPAYPSPLRDSTTVRDLDPTSQAVPASSSSTAADSAKTASSAGASAGEHKPTTVENVLSAISGAAVTAPVAAAEAISAKASELLQSSKGPASSGAQTTSATASKALAQASAQAGVLASTASEKLAGFSQNQKLARVDLSCFSAGLLPGS